DEEVPLWLGELPGAGGPDGSARVDVRIDLRSDPGDGFKCRVKVDAQLTQHFRVGPEPGQSEHMSDACNLAAILGDDRQHLVLLAELRDPDPGDQIHKTVIDHLAGTRAERGALGELIADSAAEDIRRAPTTQQPRDLC